MPKHSRLRIHQKKYFIHGYKVGLDHTLVQIEISFGKKEARNMAFKWNVSYLRGEIIDLLEERWKRCPNDASFFYKLRHITRLYRQISKQKARDFKKKKLDTGADLEKATAEMHEDVYNEAQQGEVSRLKHKLDELKTRKARGVAIRSRVKWQKVGDKCTSEFFKSVRQKNSQSIILVLKDSHGKSFMKREDLEKIVFDFYQNLYRYKEVSEEAI